MRRAKPCERCGVVYRPTGIALFRIEHPRPSAQYSYAGRLSEELWRQIHAARAEAATAALFRPGASI